MKRAVFAFILLFFCNNVYAEIVIDKLEDPEYLNGPKTTYNNHVPFYNTGSTTAKRTYNLNSGQLSKVERKVFGRTYVGDDATNRLQRLESNVFGAVQTGDENNRLKRLSSATQNYANKYPEYTAYNNGNYYNYYNAYNNPYYNRYTPYRPYNNPYARQGIRRLFRTIRNNGSLTGYTPPVNTYSQDTFYNNSFTSYPSSNGYYTGAASNPNNFTNLFSNGQSGSETYYDDGRYRRNLSSSSGGCGVKVIY